LEAIPEVENEKEKEELEYFETDMVQRKGLPALKQATNISVWKILKDMIGKDLSKFCVPVYFNEPISMLQKVAEVFDCEELLQKAGKAQDPVMRMAYVAAFSVAQYCGTENRTTKPFNPILGETFEMKGDGWKYISE